jgi:hypothetical protein
MPNKHGLPIGAQAKQERTIAAFEGLTARLTRPASFATDDGAISVSRKTVEKWSDWWWKLFTMLIDDEKDEPDADTE